MATRAYIALGNPDGTETLIYVHYDGYPAHMLPTLTAWTAAVGREAFERRLLAMKEVRSITLDQIDGFADARLPQVVPRGERIGTVGHVYRFEGEWRPSKA